CVEHAFSKRYCLAHERQHSPLAQRTRCRRRRPIHARRYASPPVGWNTMVFNTPNIQGAIDFLKSKNARFRNDVVEGFGGKQILVLDPSGNLVELVEPKRE